ncbi:hypothetical protein Tco_0051798 [Tanacetum coccineum]
MVTSLSKEKNDEMKVKSETMVGRVGSVTITAKQHGEEDHSLKKVIEDSFVFEVHDHKSLRKADLWEASSLTKHSTLSDKGVLSKTGSSETTSLRVESSSTLCNETRRSKFIWQTSFSNYHYPSPRITSENGSSRMSKEQGWEGGNQGGGSEINGGGIRFLNFFNDPRIIREQRIAAYKGYRGGRHIGGLEGDEEGLVDVLVKLETSLDEVFTPCDAAARNEETRNHVINFIQYMMKIFVVEGV